MIMNEKNEDFEEIIEKFYQTFNPGENVGNITNYEG